MFTIYFAYITIYALKWRFPESSLILFNTLVTGVSRQFTHKSHCNDK